MYYMGRNAPLLSLYHRMYAPYHTGYGMYPPHNGYYQPAPQMNHMYPQQQYVNQPQGGHNIPSQLFHNPLQTEEDQLLAQYQVEHTQPYQIPKFPKQAQPGHFNSFLNSFKSQSGSLDLNKMMDTAGQMMNALTQVSNMAKGLGGFFKS